MLLLHLSLSSNQILLNQVLLQRISQILSPILLITIKIIVVTLAVRTTIKMVAVVVARVVLTAKYATKEDTQLQSAFTDSMLLMFQDHHSKIPHPVHKVLKVPLFLILLHHLGDLLVFGQNIILELMAWFLGPLHHFPHLT